MSKGKAFLFGGVMVALSVVVVGLYINYQKIVEEERRQCYCSLNVVLEEDQETSSILWSYTVARDLKEDLMFPLEWGDTTIDSLLDAIEHCPDEIQENIQEVFFLHKTAFGNCAAGNATADKESRRDLANLAHTEIGKAITKIKRSMETLRDNDKGFQMATCPIQ